MVQLLKRELERDLGEREPGPGQVFDRLRLVQVFHGMSLRSHIALFLLGQAKVLSP